MKNQYSLKEVFSSILIATSALITGCDNATGTNSGGNSQDFAEVLAKNVVTRTVEVPREECRDEIVTLTDETKDPNQIVGTVAGAVIGGVIGNQIGKGKGNDAATVAGAVAGGYAGNQVQEGMQERNTYQETRTSCVTIFDSKEETAGYEVTYLFNGVERTITMDYDPGPRIPVANGVLVLKN
jgi:uncharacterized protein YcfJ